MLREGANAFLLRGKTLNAQRSVPNDLCKQNLSKHIFALSSKLPYSVSERGDMIRSDMKRGDLQKLAFVDKERRLRNEVRRETHMANAEEERLARGRRPNCKSQ